MLRTSPLLYALLLVGSGNALADEYARVISSTPVVQQVPVTRQVCGTQQVVTQAPRSGGGAVLGAIAGGAIGNSVGRGSGRALATMVGVLGGAALGDQVEGSGPAQVRNVQQCSNQTVYENQTTWSVVYEYAGRHYSVQMPNDPGPTLRLQVQSAAPVVQQPIATVSSYTTVAPAVAPTVVYAQPVYAPAPVYVAPAYAYPPVGVSLNLGWSNWRGGDYGGWHHGHWR